jgi:hypothetical protein
LLGKQTRRGLTPWSNGPRRNRHPEHNFSKKKAKEAISCFVSPEESAVASIEMLPAS